MKKNENKKITIFTLISSYMKTILIFLQLLFIMFPFTADSQSFIRDIKTTEDELCIGFIENPQGGYFISILRGTYKESDPLLLEYRNIIYKMDVMGNLTDSVSLPGNDSLDFTGCAILMSSGEIVAISSVFTKGDIYHNRALRIARLDFNLKINNDVIYWKPGYYLTAGPSSLISNGNLVMAVHPQSIATGEWYAAVMEITPDGELVQEHIITEPIPSGRVVELGGGNGYLLTDLNMIVSLDESLNYQNLLYKHQDNDPLWFIMASFKAVSDTQCLVSGWKPWDSFNAAWSVINIDGTWEEQHDFGISGVNDHAGGADFVSTDNIYIARAAEMEGYTEWSLFNFKLDGTENWHHNYTYNGYHFTGFWACATNDNSCIILGRYQTENSSLNEYDLVFMKLNEDGSVIGMGEPGEVKTGISLYPNPGTDKITINGSVAGCELSLFDNTGREVYCKILDGENASLSVCNLSPGFYTYSVRSKNSIYSGKWIKTK